MTSAGDSGPTAADRWDDIDISPAGDPLPRFKDNEELQVRVATCAVGRSYDGSWKATLWCEVIGDNGRLPGPTTVVRLPLYMKLPARGRDGRFAPAPLGSKFYRMWVVATGGQKPSRRDRMSLEVFKDRLLMGKCRTVTKDNRGKLLPPALQYSVIDEFIR